MTEFGIGDERLKKVNANFPEVLDGLSRLEVSAMAAELVDIRAELAALRQGSGSLTLEGDEKTVREMLGYCLRKWGCHCEYVEADKPMLCDTCEALAALDKLVAQVRWDTERDVLLRVSGAWTNHNHTDLLTWINGEMNRLLTPKTEANDGTP